MRISKGELAGIQLEFGFDSEAIQTLRTTFDECTAVEDQYAMARRIMVTSFETGNHNF